MSLATLWRVLPTDLAYQKEAGEIATYTVIDALATSVGDKQTSKLARDIRKEEERMALYLADLLPELATNVAHDTIPVSQIEGDARRRTAGDAKTPRTRPEHGEGQAAQGGQEGPQRPGTGRLRYDRPGGVPEWLNGAVSKTVVRLTAHRGFESLPLRRSG